MLLHAIDARAMAARHDNVTRTIHADYTSCVQGMLCQHRGFGAIGELATACTGGQICQFFQTGRIVRGRFLWYTSLWLKPVDAINNFIVITMLGSVIGLLLFFRLEKPQLLLHGEVHFHGILCLAFGRPVLAYFLLWPILKQTRHQRQFQEIVEIQF